MAFAIEKQTIFTTILSKLLFKKRSLAAAATCCLQSDRTVIYLHLPLSVNAAKMRPLRDGVPVDQPNKTL